MTREWKAPSYDQCRSIYVKDVAVLVRKVLKEAFPNIKFSVRIEKYSMGASIYVQWTDGPTEATVRTHTKMFEGSRYEDESKVYHDVLLDGEWVHFFCDSVDLRRQMSLDLINRADEHYRNLLKNDPRTYERIFASPRVRLDLLKNDPRTHERIFGNQAWFGSPDSIKFHHARYFSDVEPKGSTTVTRLVLENDARHPAFAQR